MPQPNIARRSLLKGLSASSLLLGSSCGANEAMDVPPEVDRAARMPQTTTPGAAGSDASRPADAPTVSAGAVTPVQMQPPPAPAPTPPPSMTPPAKPAAPPVAPPLASGRDQWTDIREQFELSKDYLHFASFLFASHPKPVRDAIERHRRAFDENPADTVEQLGNNAPVLQAAAQYFGCPQTEIALTDSTTMGLGLLYSGMTLRAGDDVVTTTHDHYSTHEALRVATARAGATLRKISLYTRPEDATVDGMVQAIESAVTAQTRVVAITWVHSGTGVKTPVKAIADRLAAINASRAATERIVFCVDGVHGFGVEDETADSLGCDFFVAGTHKWMFGPRGTGIIWGRAALWRTLQPLIPAFGAPSQFAWFTGSPPPPTTADMVSPGGYHSYEYRWALGEAFKFHQSIGKAAVTARIRELNQQCKEGLAGMSHVTLHTPMSSELSAGIVTFEVARMTPSAVVARLREKRIIATTTPYATSYARLSPSLVNSPAEVDTVLGEIRAMG